jgi:hypothetical protein
MVGGIGPVAGLEHLDAVAAREADLVRLRAVRVLRDGGQAAGSTHPSNQL